MRIKNKSIYIVLIVVALIGITIGYAVINTTLNINGKSSISKNTWDVYFDNVVVKDDSVEAVKIPTVTDKTTVDFEVALNLPGDYYEFTVDVKNSGSIDAMIDSVEKTPNLTTKQEKYLNYIIEYENKEQITTKQLVKSNEFVRLKVRVEFKKDITATDLPTNNETLILGFNVNYVQADNTGINVNNNGIKVVTANGSLDEIGTIVTIGTEQFYTIGTEGDNVKLLSAMNITLEDNPIQSSSAGETAYSNTSNDYSGSIVEGYVNNYENALETNFGVDIVEARLITKDELTSEKIGCSESDYSCSNTPSFIRKTAYWSGSAYGTYDVWNVHIGGNFGFDGYFCEGGVRPVIVISKSYF